MQWALDRLKQYQIEGLQVRIIGLQVEHCDYGHYVRIGDIVEGDYYLRDLGKLLIKATGTRSSFVLYKWDEGEIWEIVSPSAS